MSKANIILSIIAVVLLAVLIGSAIDSNNKRKVVKDLETKNLRIQSDLDSVILILNQRNERVEEIIKYRDSVVIVTEYRTLDRINEEESIIDEIQDRSLDGTAVVSRINEHLFSTYPFDTLDRDSVGR